MSLNSAIIMGRLTKDIEERRTNSGKAVCSFCVAVDRRFSKDETDFIDITAFDKTAEFVCKYFTKGSMIAIQGNIQTRMYEDKNGNKRKAVEIIAENVSFCGGKSDNANTTSEPATVPDAPVNDSDFREIPEDEDLPF